MIFNSFEFLWLMPLIVCLYYLLSGRKSLGHIFPEIGNFLLIVISYGLYIKWKPVYALILLWVTAVTFVSAKTLDGVSAKVKKCRLCFTGLLLALMPLLLFKYYNFVTSQLEYTLYALGIQTGLPGLNWAMPIGISFFSLQAVGYLADVYLGRIPAERNWWHYMLYVSFFPQIASGPISKAKDLLPQIKASRQFNPTQAIQGLRWILWGMFMKVVVADGIGLHTDISFNTWEKASGANLLIASLLYSFQIYSDFAGYSFMALGGGKLLGFDLVNNFNRPYFSVSITDFWRRWHISLSTWLKDYIFIPLGGSRCGKIRNYTNILVTFLVSGIWHGANWTFIVWGVLHGAVQIVEKHLGLHRKQSDGTVKALRIVVTFTIITFLWIFFRMPSISDAMGVIGKIFTDFGTLTERPYWALLLIAVVILKDTADEFDIKSLRLLRHKYLFIRWATYLLLLSAIAISGVYGGTFIYSGF